MKRKGKKKWVTTIFWHFFMVKMKEFKKENMDHKIELSSPEVLCKSNLL